VSATIPAIHALHLLALLGRWNVDTRTFAEELGLSEEALSQPGARISVELAERVIVRAREVTGERELGFFFGLQMRISAHGFLGFAAMTAPTARSAVALIPRFLPTLTDALSITLRYGEHDSSLRLEPRVPLGEASDVIITAILIGLWQMANTVTQHPLLGETEVTFDEPSQYRTRFLHLTPRPIRFGAAHNQLTIENTSLDMPLLMADPAAQKLATEQCDRELLLLAQKHNVEEQTRALLNEPSGLTLTLADVAKRLHTSERTLKRRLMEHGTSYALLLDQARRERTLLLLQSAELSLADIAERVGYTELSNFTRAFRRWTGVTPHRFRRSLR
jgi:AraC-like DNA-binding protein